MRQASVILGIGGALGHDANATLLDGRLVSASQEERFTRIKHEWNSPRLAINLGSWRAPREAKIKSLSLYGYATNTENGEWPFLGSPKVAELASQVAYP